MSRVTTRRGEKKKEGTVEGRKKGEREREREGGGGGGGKKDRSLFCSV